MPRCVPIVPIFARLSENNRPSDSSAPPENMHHLVLLQTHLRRSLRLERVQRAVQPRQQRSVFLASSGPGVPSRLEVVIVVNVVVLRKLCEITTSILVRLRVLAVPSSKLHPAPQTPSNSSPPSLLCSSPRQARAPPPRIIQAKCLSIRRRIGRARRGRLGTPSILFFPPPIQPARPVRLWHVRTTPDVALVRLRKPKVADLDQRWRDGRRLARDRRGGCRFWSWCRVVRGRGCGRENAGCRQA